MNIDSIKATLLNTSRRNKKTLSVTVDFCAFFLSSILAYFISSGSVDTFLDSLIFLLIFYFLGLFALQQYGVYRSLVRYINISTFYLIFKAITLAFLIFLAGITASIEFFKLADIDLKNPMSFVGWITLYFNSLLFIFGTRIFANYLFSDLASEKRVIIYGAGSAGIQLCSALRVSSEFQPVAFVDTKRSLQKTILAGIKVYPPDKLQKLIRKLKIDEVLIAIPSASKSTLKQLLTEVEKLSIKVRILPGLADLAQGKVLVSELKEVNINDLLGRLEVEAQEDLINKNIKNKIVLVTGAGGSIGSEISRQVIKAGAKKLILLDANEYSLFSIKKEFESLDCESEIIGVMGNVTDRIRMDLIIRSFEVDTVYHTAAYKHVHLVEENPFEAVLNNIFGTYTTLKASLDNRVETFVLISTDKAVRPTNIMGATKRFAELILQAYAIENNHTNITMVRFGNVIGSSGSAIPLFLQQIKTGGPVTVTHPEVIRYFMSIPEAAELVIQAGALGEGGDVFVLDMGEPVKILDLAKKIINLSGMSIKDDDNPQGDIEIKITGLKPGEKLYEELLIGTNVSKTSHKRILRAEEKSIDHVMLSSYLDKLNLLTKENDVTGLIHLLKEVIPEYEPEKKIVDVIKHNSSKI